jgi:predicted O-linked N-acetylglucosamine transferase (SPINDLY family)
MKFAIIIATRDRPEQAATVIGAARMMASGEHEIEFIVACDDDDPETQVYPFGPSVNVHCAPRPPGISACWNRCIPLTDAEMIVALTDDGLVACPNWDRIVAAHVTSIIPALAVIAWHDSANPTQSTIIMAHRKWIDLAAFFDERFPFWFSDTAIDETYSFVTGHTIQRNPELLIVTKPGKFNPRLRDMDLWWDLYAATRTERLATAARIRARLGLPKPDLATMVAMWEARDAIGRPASHTIAAAIEKPAEVSNEYIAAKKAAEEYLERMPSSHVGVNQLQAKFQEGFILHQKGQLTQAQAIYEQILKLQPRHFDTLHLLGVIAFQTANPGQAAELIGKAIEVNSNNAAAYSNRGNALRDLNRSQAALESYDRAISLKPDYAEAFNNRGNALRDLNRSQAALESYDRAISLKPDYAEAFNNRGNALLDLKQPQAAVKSYEQALALNPDYEFLFGTLLLAKMQICDWSNSDRQIADLLRKIQDGDIATTPFPTLTLTSDASLQKRAAQIYVEARHPLILRQPYMSRRDRHDKIRVGYYSADFHDHAVAHLMAQVFELHDKRRFERIAFSFGADDQGEMRRRLSVAFDSFLDVRDQSDRDVALLSRKIEVDIAVDLSGYTTGSRPNIFAHRAAPIQVNYLGYPGTMAADYIDYLIADTTLIPQESRKHYTENIVYLPNSYQPNNGTKISEKSFTRRQFGLPSSGFVFCCFNNSYKITPGMFDGWMRVLCRVNGSVLWLLKDSPTAAANLRKEAVRRGVDGERLVFAERMPLAEHLARHRIADLFIDTLPYNAHTTASDALWAGLPVVTCVGEAFASRVAASVLKAIGLPELITTTQQEYEALAIELATNPARLTSIRQKLGRNKLSTPLFDTKRYVKHLERAYTMMYERHQRGLPPDDFYVESSID